MFPFPHLIHHGISDCRHGTDLSNDFQSNMKYHLAAEQNLVLNIKHDIPSEWSFPGWFDMISPGKDIGQMEHPLSTKSMEEIPA